MAVVARTFEPMNLPIAAGRSGRCRRSFTEHDIGVRIERPSMLAAAVIFREIAELRQKTSPGFELPSDREARCETCLGVDLQSASATCARHRAHPWLAWAQLLAFLLWQISSARRRLQARGESPCACVGHAARIIHVNPFRSAVR
jgi:hypothetical protein